MAAVCINRKGWDHIMAPALQEALPKMNVCRNFPRRVVYGPHQYQGLDLNDPYFWQFFIHVRTLIQEVSKTSITGTLLRGTIEQFKLETGFPGSITEFPDDIINMTTERTWIKETVKFMKSVEMNVVDPIAEISPYRINDQAIMKGFYDIGFRKHQLFILNIVRIRCKAIYLSEITTGDGRMIRTNSWEGRADHIIIEGKDWPRSPAFLPKDWIKLWQHALLKSFGETLQAPTMVLRTPLKQWIEEFNRSWKLWHHDNRLYLQGDTNVTIYQRTRNTRNAKKYTLYGNGSTIPEAAQCATGDPVDRHIIFTGSFGNMM